MLLICITIKNEAFKLVLIVFTYRKIPIISPGAYIFERPFWRSLFLEGLIYGGKFASQNRLGYPYSWKKIYSLFYFVFEGNFQVQAPRGAYIWRGDLTEGFLRYEFEGLVHGGAYFRNVTVLGSLSNDEGSVNKNAMTFFLLHFSSIHHRA